jgi:hypothetical protein
MVLDVAKSLAFPHPLLDLAHQQLSFGKITLMSGVRFFLAQITFPFSCTSLYST